MIRDFVALDLETTGLNPVEDEILEIGAVRFEDGVITGEYQTFVKCKLPLNPRIVSLTGIDDSMAEGGIGLEDALTELFEFLKDSVILGHNIKFDFAFLKMKAKECGMNFQCMGIDTLAISRKLLKDLESRKLEYLGGYFKVPMEASHRAVDDSKTAAYVYYELIKLAGEKDEKYFKAKELTYKEKKETPITPAQKGYLNDLLKYHKIKTDVKIEDMTKSQASREIDGIISKYGIIPRENMW